MFWSGETLIKHGSTLITPFKPDRVDCAAYTLSIGPEVYVSPSDQRVDPNTVTIRKLEDGGAFTIPPGQFAFLLTDEVVTVPDDMLAFISIRAKIKFHGLVNVSGFHVDPGYRGQLTFSVFNAGPIPIHLKQGCKIFLIWYASLDQTTNNKKDDKTHMGINSGMVTKVAGELQSFASISNKIQNVNETLANRIHALEKEQSYYRVIGTITLALATFLLTSWLSTNWPF